MTELILFRINCCASISVRGKRVVCYCSVAKSHITNCDPMDCSMPGFTVLHYLLEFEQTHVHWVNDAIQAPHPLSPTSPPDLKLSQHQGFFSNELALPIWWPKYWSISPSDEYSGLISLELTGLISLQSKGLFSSIRFESINSLVLRLLYGLTLKSVHDYRKSHSFD